MDKSDETNYKNNFPKTLSIQKNFQRIKRLKIKNENEYRMRNTFSNSPFNPNLYTNPNYNPKIGKI